MKATNKQTLAFVESLGGLAKLMEALQSGSSLLKKADEALTLKKAELDLASEANESLEKDLGKATQLLESNSRQRRSASMFLKDKANSKIEESVHNPRTPLVGRLITQHKNT